MNVLRRITTHRQHPTDTAVAGPSGAAAATLFASLLVLPAVALAGPLDHFQCYQTTTLSTHVVLPDVRLSDEIGAFAATVSGGNICTPTDKNHEDPSAPTHADHLVSYAIKPRARLPLAGLLPRRVTLSNQFGSQDLSVLSPRRLLVPSSESLDQIPTAPASPALDHFLCYSARRAKGTPRFHPLANLSVEDQFGGASIAVLRPEQYCTPVDKNGEGIPDPTAHLVCYRIRGAFRPIDQIFVANQFGSAMLYPRARRLLCVPSSVNGPTATATSTPTTPTATASPNPRTATPTAIPTTPPTATPTITPNPRTATPTAIPTTPPTATPTITPNPTPTATPANTPTATESPSPTPTRTATATPSPPTCDPGYHFDGSACVDIDECAVCPGVYGAYPACPCGKFGACTNTPGSYSCAFSPPNVTTVSPYTVTIDSAAAMTISGVRLGLDQDDLVSITVGNIPCVSPTHVGGADSETMVTCNMAIGTPYDADPDALVVVTTKSGGAGSCVPHPPTGCAVILECFPEDRDCHMVCHGDAKLDPCGVCEGDGSSC